MDFRVSSNGSIPATRHADAFVIALGQAQAQAQRSLPRGRPRADIVVPPGAVAHRVSVAMATR
jgi:hypothetical protein